MKRPYVMMSPPVTGFVPAAGGAPDDTLGGAGAALTAFAGPAGGGIRPQVVTPKDICVSVTVNNGQACLQVPIIGNVCIPVPSFIPNGTVASVCADICTKFFVPCGAKVTVNALGHSFSKGFGCC